MTTFATITVNSLHEGKKLKVQQRYPNADVDPGFLGYVDNVGETLSIVVHDANEVVLTEVDKDEVPTHG